MERTTTVTGDVPKFSGKLVLQATDQHAGGKFDELVLPQRGVSFERLNNIMNLSPNRERAIDLAPSMNVGAATACDTMEGRVVPCGKAYFESEESLSYFLSKPESNHQPSEDQSSRTRVQLIHSHVEAAFASAGELGSYVNQFTTAACTCTTK